MYKFKAKAWDKINHKMYGVKEIHFDQYGVIKEVILSQYFPNNGIVEFHKRKADEVELLFFTGQKDKNNREIYDKDIIKNPCSDKLVIVFWNSKKAKFDIKGDIDPYYYDLIDIAEDFEIIGNIYETPELSKGFKLEY